jgi:LuxR family transcriptional regulator, maltose regulon positive regulatory protein
MGASPERSAAVSRALPSHTAALERVLAPRGLVCRHSLVRVLSAAGPGGVILLCAPAGSGKTVLLRSWAASDGSGDRVGWASVARNEHESQRFWLTLIDALAGAMGDDALAERVGAASAFCANDVIERLLSDLRALAEPTVLVIDDLHELRSAEALRLLELFLTRVPAQLTVVLATREDPRLALHRLRLAGTLTEIRGSDLRFSLHETRDLLQAAGIALSDDAVGLLHERTEGWVAGLRLAAISLTGHPDPERFVREFSGSERTIAGYLMAEVLEHQPPEVRDVLLRTSVLECVSGPLADVLTGRSGSERTLQELEDANAFVASLDVGRSWFRYHQLFADLLQLELRRTAPAVIRSIHRAAARWYEEHGYPVEAIRHAQAAADWRDAARLLADSYVGLGLDGRVETLSQLLCVFPREAVTDDAELAEALAGVRLLEGRVEDAAAYIDLAERGATTVSDDRRSRFELRMATTRLSLARRRGDLPAAREAMQSVEAALGAQPASELPGAVAYRAAALMNLGIAELWSRRVSDARGHLEEALILARTIERPRLEIGCLSHLGLAAPLGGEALEDGLRLTEQAVAVAEGHGWGRDPIIAAALAIHALELAWLGRFEEAQRGLERAQRALVAGAEPMIELVARHALGLLAFGERRLEEALAAFRDAARLKAQLNEDVPLIDPLVRMLQVQAWMGQTTAARGVLAELGEDERNRPGMRIAAATLDLTQENPQRALEVLARVIDGSEQPSQLPLESIEALVLDAAVRDAIGDARAAAESLERALGLAQPDGIVLPFVLAPVGPLLVRHSEYRTAHATLLTEILELLAGCSPRPNGASRPLPDDLSAAELRVVGYLPSNLKAPEIAAELYVSPNTVRTHLRHIYAKLDAHSRSEAVARARESGLVARGSAGRLRSVA